MASFTCNPYLAVCPDFASETFARRRQSIAFSGLSEQQIIEFMQGTWHDANEADKQNWARIVLGKPVEDEDAAKMRDALAARMEARKKIPNFYAMTPIPTDFPRLPSDAVMAKLRRGEHVPLWHFTLAGLKSARDNRDENGAEFASALQSVVPDSKLSAEDFSVSSVRLLQMMGLTHWPQKVIDMFHLFFDDIHCHPYRISYDDCDWKALIRYADEQRQLWHMRTKDLMAGNTALYPLKVDEDKLNSMRRAVTTESAMERAVESQRQYQEMLLSVEQECAFAYAENMRFGEGRSPSPVERSASPTPRNRRNRNRRNRRY